LPAALAALAIVASQILDPPAAAGVLAMANVSLAVELESRSGTSTTRRRAAQDSA
jgi:hypothetical protein